MKIEIKRMYIEDYERKNLEERNLFNQNIKIDVKDYFFLNNNLISNWEVKWFPITDIDDYEEGIYIFDFLSIYKLATGKKEISLGESRAKFYCPFEIKSNKFATLEKENCFSYLEGFQRLDVEKEWEIEINTRILSNEDIEFKVTLYFNTIIALKFEVILITSEKKEFYNLQKLKEEKEKFEKIKEKREEIKKQFISYFKDNFEIYINLYGVGEYYNFSFFDFEEWNVEEGFSTEVINPYGDDYRRYYSIYDLEQIIEIIKNGKEIEIDKEDYLYKLIKEENNLKNVVLKKIELEEVGEIIFLK